MIDWNKTFKETGYKIKEINKLAFNYLLGDYNGNSY